MKGAVVVCALLLAAITPPALAEPSAEVAKVREWRAGNERPILADLMQLVSLPNVAPNKADIEKNAATLQRAFDRRGFAVMRVETPGSPILIARRDVQRARGTLIFYMHYDGQPVDAKEWTRGAPFAPAAFLGDTPLNLDTVSGRIDPEVRIYGRSAADDKGPIIALLAALDGLAATRGRVAWNLRVVLDGEEEMASPNFDAAMKPHAADVRGDIAIIVDSPRHPSGLSTLFHGSRGGVTAVVTVFGASGDLHSGNYGNFVTDPGMALAKLLASMKDGQNDVAIKGFYDGVVPLTTAEQRLVDAIPNVDAKLLEQFGLARAEHPESRIEMQHNLPTLSISGLESGAVGAGARAAIPGTASARIGIRLVKGLTPRVQFDRVVAHIRAQGYHIVDGEPDAATRRQYPLIARVTQSGTSFIAARTPMEDARTAPVVAAIRSLGQPVAQLPTIGGGVPPFTTFSETLGIPTLGLAVVNFDNNQHAANENLRVGHLWEAIDAFAALVTMRK